MIETARHPVATLVVGIGHPWRGDDGVGPAVTRRLREIVEARGSTEEVEILELDQPLGLISAWTDAERVVVVDAARSGAPPGTIHSACEGRLPATLAAGGSTHGFGVAEAIAMARHLGAMPPMLEIHAIEGASFEPGRGLTADVERAALDLAERLASTLTDVGVGARVSKSAATVRR